MHGTFWLNATNSGRPNQHGYQLGKTLLLWFSSLDNEAEFQQTPHPLEHYTMHCSKPFSGGVGQAHGNTRSALYIREVKVGSERGATERRPKFPICIESLISQNRNRTTKSHKKIKTRGSNQLEALYITKRNRGPRKYGCPVISKPVFERARHKNFPKERRVS